MAAWICLIFLVEEESSCSAAYKVMVVYCVGALPGVVGMEEDASVRSLPCINFICTSDLFGTEDT